MTIKIEKGIPIPSGMQGNRRYPWLEMDVGDSFVCKAGKSIRSSASAAGTSYGRKFRVQKEHDGTYRVWRVK